MPVALTNVNLIVTDIARARQFYVDLLGLTVDPDEDAPPTFLLLQAGPATLTLQDAAAAGETPGAGAGMEIGFETDDLDRIAARLTAAGYGDAPVQVMGWGRALSVRDPDGHRLNLFTRR